MYILIFMRARVSERECMLERHVRDMIATPLEQTASSMWQYVWNLELITAHQPALNVIRHCLVRRASEWWESYISESNLSQQTGTTRMKKAVWTHKPNWSALRAGAPAPLRTNDTTAPGVCRVRSTTEDGHLRILWSFMLTSFTSQQWMGQHRKGGGHHTNSLVKKCVILPISPLVWSVTCVSKHSLGVGGSRCGERWNINTARISPCR